MKAWREIERLCTEVIDELAHGLPADMFNIKHIRRIASAQQEMENLEAANG